VVIDAVLFGTVAGEVDLVAELAFRDACGKGLAVLGRRWENVAIEAVVFGIDRDLVWRHVVVVR
jgi:hypothetical protein